MNNEDTPNDRDKLRARRFAYRLSALVEEMLSCEQNMETEKWRNLFRSHMISILNAANRLKEGVE